MAAVTVLAGGASLVAAAADGRLSLLDARGASPLIAQVPPLPALTAPDAALISAACLGMTRQFIVASVPAARNKVK